jgi:hypothetical protein
MRAPEEKSMSPKELRLARRLPRIQVAARGGVSEPSVRLYELDPACVSPRIKRELDKVYADLAAEAVAPEVR